MQCANKNSYWQIVAPYSQASLAPNVQNVTILQHLLIFLHVDLSKRIYFFIGKKRNFAATSPEIGEKFVFV
jgi:hypothetical protein